MNALPLTPDPEALPRAAQIVRIFGPLSLDNVTDFTLDTTPDSSEIDGVRYTLRVEAVRQITRAQAVAIVDAQRLQLLHAEDVVTWEASLVREYRRQYEAKMRLPNPPILIHPDHAEQVWEAANGPLPTGRNY